MSDILLACTNPSITSKGIWVTAAAQQRLRDLYGQEKNEGAPTVFRIRVDSGGCSGFQYAMGFDATQNQDDVMFESGDLKIVTDTISLPLLDGLHIDYVEELIGSSFQLKNPNAAMACGCGNSFTLGK